MLELENYRALARYNHRMNQQLLDACALLPAAERKRATGAPFGSMHGLWNHLLLTDRAWLARFNGEPVPFRALDEEICADFEELRAQRDLTDAAIARWVETLSAAKLAAPLRFTSLSNPTPRAVPLWVAATHLFNHQTHHRGQLTALLEQAGGDCGVTDFAALPEFQL